MAGRSALAGAVRPVVAAGWLDGPGRPAQGVQDLAARLASRRRLEQFRRGVGDLLDGIEAGRDPLEVLAHRADQEDYRDQQQDGEQQTERSGLADVLGELFTGRGEQIDAHRTPTSLRIPVNRSSSGTATSTRDRANS